MNVILLYAAVDGRDRADHSGSPMNYKNKKWQRAWDGRKGMEEERASEIYRHDEKRWKAPTLIYRRGSGSAILAKSSSCGRERAPWSGEDIWGKRERRRERERESHAVSMDRKSGPPSSQPVGTVAKLT